MFVVRCYLGVLLRGWENLEAPGKGTVLFFSLVRKEPKVPQRFANLWTPGTIQSFAGNIFEEASDNTSRNWLFAQDGGEKALNRCEIQALQRKDLERTAKEEPCSLRTVGYGWAEMGGGGRKRVALDGNKERLMQMIGFGFAKKAASKCS